MQNRQWLLKNRPEGPFKESDFERRDVEVPALKEGQALIKTLYLSFDPTQRGWAGADTYLPAVKLGAVMRAIGVAQVIETKNAKYQKGDLVGGLVGWQDYCIIDHDQIDGVKFAVLPPYIDIPLLLALMGTGLTAYFGMKEIGQPKTGDTVLVSGAAGATGSIAGQIAKLKGARVIGIAGGKEKCQWVTETAHFDAAIDYKNEDVERRLAELCPQGIDVYFDNVGGEILDAALLHLAMHARVVICGQISQYDKITSKEMTSRDGDRYGVKGISMLILRRAKMEGFLVTDYLPRSAEGLLCLAQWVKAGKIVQEIDLQEGFDNIPGTLLRIFQGKNLGKQLLKLADPSLPLNKHAMGELLFRGYLRYVAWREEAR